MSESSPKLSGLSREQLDQLIRRLQQKKATEAPSAAAGPASLVRRAGDRSRAPLSSSQRRLWLIDQIEPGSPAYNIPLAVRLSGQLSVRALRASLSAIVERHEVLRTTFAAPEEGEPEQRIAPPAPVALPLLDLSALPEAAARALAEERARKEARQPFDLARGPLMRATLLRQGPEEHVLLLTQHHIVSDGWSMGVFVRELAAFYRAEASGTPAGLPELPVQYADYAAWQQELLASGEVGRQLEGWKQALAGAPEALDLPTDRRRPPLPSYRGANVRHELPPAVLEAAQKLARETHSTLFMVLATAFATLLARLSGASDLCLGAPIANRRSVEVEGLIGFFVNTLVLRADLGGDPTFRAALARVSEVTTAAYSRQDVPFEQLVEELAPRRDLAKNALFQVAFLLQNAPMGRFELPGLVLELIPVDSGTAKFDLLVAATEGPQGLATGWEYATDLFDAATIAAMAERFGRLLEAALARPELRLSELPLLSSAEAAALAGPLAGEPLAEVPEGTLDDLVFARALENGAAEALVVGRDRLSFSDLCLRAQTLADQLAALGVGPEERVGVCMERNAGLVVGLLAVLRAGGTYVPIDPAYPRERIGWMLEDAAARFVLSGGGALASLEGLGGFRILPLSADGHCEALPGAEAGQAPRRGRHGARNLAYLIYTSGSTGRPKAVAIEHRSAVALVAWSERHFSARELAGVLAATSVCFDLSVFELFVTLARGGRVILAADALALPGLPAKNEVRLINTVPSAMAALVESGGVPDSVETVCLAGEPLTRALTDAVYRLSHVARVWNLYGPSEDTTYSTAVLVPRGSVEEPTIGRPLAGTQAYVVDRHGRLQPPGVPGELRLGGLGLSRGYLGRPGTTAERYPPDPWGSSPGARLYATGDLVRLRPDGELAFLGRIDHQVKVRGFRIELGEIEAALVREPGVREAVVVVRGERGDARIVAYLAGDGGEALLERLRASLGERLPAYMVPGAFLLLPALPRTPNGKVDRKALPEPVWGGATRERVPPATATEEVLLGLWQDLLKVGDLGVTDNFFELGGHSLLATRLVSRLRQSFGVELPLRRLFEAPTVRELARLVEAAERDEAAPRPPATIERQARPAVLPLSYAQERLWFLDRMDPGASTYNISTVVRLLGPLDAALLGRCLGQIVARHESLRTRFPSESGVPRQQIDPPFELAVPVVDLGASGKSGAQLEAELMREARLEAEAPFDLERGPLLRLRLFRLSEREHVAVATQHHIISDGWSAGIFFRELTALYRHGGSAEIAGLPELPIQYADFSLWQREWFAHGELDRQLAYWKAQLAGAPELAELPTDRPRPPVATVQGRRLPVALRPETEAALRQLGRAEGATFFMVLYALYSAWLARLSGALDIVVGTPVANRGRHELEGLIGFFVNTLVLRLGLTGRPSARELVRRSRKVTFDAYAHQDVPFEKLVAELQQKRSRSHAPLFQVMLALQNAGLAGLGPGEAGPEELALEPVTLPGSTTKFDLTLALSEGPEGVAGIIGFRTELFDGATVERWMGLFERLLASATAEPERPFDTLPWLRAEEEQELLAGSRGAGAQAHPFAGLAEQLGRASAAHPAALAVACEGAELSHGELDARASRLARALMRLGVGPESFVAIALSKSIEMVVAVVAVLKSGGAYVPLDPTHPPERLAELLDDFRPRVLLTEEGLLPAFASLALAQAPAVLAVDAPSWGADGAAEPSGESFAVAVEPGWLAYMIYTSGSTGKPKGVMNTHGAIAARIATLAERHRLGPEDRQLQFASLTFDMSCEEMFPVLVAGGAVVLQPRPGQLRPLEVLDAAERQGVTKVTFPSSYCHQLVDELVAAGRRWPASIRFLATGAEAPSREKFAELSGLADRPVECWNYYGPTETTIIVCGSRIPLGTGEALPERFTIGVPLPGCHLYVLDRRLAPQPLTVAGELVIGGDGIARGYLGRPAGTAEKFIPDPFSGLAGARLYRTGDLVRRRADGELEFLGRIDQQVKVRGFRIELGEIEEQLRRHPALVDAAVALRQDAAGDPRLVAYLAAGAEREPSVDELRAFLATRLPEYMIPALYVMLPALPKTTGGKVDYRSLPDLEAAQVRTSETFVAPTSPVELFLAELWGEVLGLERVGATDNFFRLGGDSLKGAVLIRRLEEKIGSYVYVTALFDTQDLADLARYLEKQYPEAMARMFGLALPGTGDGQGYPPVDRARLAAFDRVIAPLPPFPAPPGRATNPPAVVILSPPRSGSTLLRVMLAGNPRLFSPPELELAGFNTLGERRRAFSGKYALWLEGVLRAVMELAGLDADAARERMEEYEAADLPVRDFYRLLQGWAGERLLVDKTPSYALDAKVLERLEEDFEDCLYVHLIRHPLACIRSFEEARLEQTFFRHEHPFERRELAEMIWVRSHENILRFLEGIPAERQHAVRFEQLVAAPEEPLRSLCGFLGVPFEAGMLEPYADKKSRMTDGIHQLSKMVGDVKFHEHKKVDAATADRWREVYAQNFLAAPAREMAAHLGYADVAAPDEPALGSQDRCLVALRPGAGGRPVFLIHAIFGDVYFFRHLAAALPASRPVFALKSVGLDGEAAPLTSVPAMVERYLAAIEAVQPEGPYTLAGSSMGGILAYELARELERRGKEVALVAMLDSPDPEGIAPGFGEIDFAAAALSYLVGDDREELALGLARVSGREERLAFVLEAAKACGSLPPRATLADLAQLAEVVEANRQALQPYRPEPYGGRLLHVRARETASRLAHPEVSGWAPLCAGGVEVAILDGGHMSILFPPQVGALAAKLGEAGGEEGRAGAARAATLGVPISS